MATRATHRRHFETKRSPGLLGAVGGLVTGLGNTVSDVGNDVGNVVSDVGDTVGDTVTALVGSGSGSGSSSTASSAAATSTSSSSSGSSGSSSGSGSSGSGSSSGSSSGSGSSSSSSGSGSSGSGSGSSSSGSSGSDSGTSSGTTDSGSGDSSSSDTSSGSGTDNSGTGTSSASSTTASGTTVSGGSSTNSTVSGQDLGAANGNAVAGSDSSPSAGAAAASGVSSGATSAGTGITYASGTSGGTATIGTGSVNTAGASGTSGSTGSSGSKSGGLSHGALAAIVVILLFAATMGIMVFVIRRNRRRRADAANKWYLGASYGATDEKNSAKGSAKGNGPASPTRASVRSSFATTFDHGLVERGASPAPPTPQRPEMAETRDGFPVVAVVPYTDHPIPGVNDRASVYSIGSTSSHGSVSQYLVAPPPVQVRDGEGSPMSVRPFSPTESFAFPKPPTESRPNTMAPDETSQEMLEEMIRTSDKWLGGTISPTPVANQQTYLTVTTPGGGNAPSPISNESFTTAQETTPAAANPFDDPTTNPFADASEGRPLSTATTMTAQTVDSTATEMAPIETIRRPFEPTLTDELKVEPGDQVRLVQAFDDGWCVVEKVPAPEKGKGKYRDSVLSATSSELRAAGRGMIPLDCLRGAGEDLPKFLASKRVSSYLSGSGVAV